MKDEEMIALRVTEDFRRKVMNRITMAHVRGLDVAKASELGVFDRMSLLLCGMNTLECVAYRLFGGVEQMLLLLGADRKHDILVACNRYQTAFEDFMKFWRGYYTSKGAPREMNDETESLYHQFMRWAGLPESWALGEPLHEERPTDEVIAYDDEEQDRVIKFYRSTVSSEVVDEPTDTYLVTRYDRSKKTQESVETGMDKASAMMVAKRLSAEDPENIYTASLLREYTEHRTEAIPLKLYRGNETVGSIRKVLRDTCAREVSEDGSE